MQRGPHAESGARESLRDTPGPWHRTRMASEFEDIVPGVRLGPLSVEDPMLWTEEEASFNGVCSTLFVKEYLFDFNAHDALRRLGVVDDEDVKGMARAYLKHPLVRRKIRLATERFMAENVLTENALLMTMWRDANDFGPGSNPVARVNAQRNAAKILGLEPDDRLKREAAKREGLTSKGVLVVWDTTDPVKLDELAEAAQAALKEEVLK